MRFYCQTIGLRIDVYLLQKPFFLQAGELGSSGVGGVAELLDQAGRLDYIFMPDELQGLYFSCSDYFQIAQPLWHLIATLGGLAVPYPLQPLLFEDSQAPSDEETHQLCHGRLGNQS